MERFDFRDVGVPLFLFAVATASWYGGRGASATALLLSCISFDYFFVKPLHTLYVTSSDLPYFIAFASFALLITWFSAVRRRVELELRQARDDLEVEVAERTQQASLLNLTHDTIFVRDMSDSHYLLEPGISGVVRLDSGRSNRQARSRAFAVGVPGPH
jgi:K+-sensing histidine kinase KdpD